VLAPEEFKRALAQFASGVTIVTTVDPQGRPTGLTASAFTSVSLTPPMILVCVAHTSNSYPSLRASDRFAVNILSQGQDKLSNRFATSSIPGPEKFDGVAFRKSALGLPLLEGAMVHIECTTAHAYPGGDHTIFVGQVETAHFADAPAPEPLLFYRGRYGRLETASSPASSQGGGSR
jgi:3-hydroxy-9,10-secoandrosta-1,3,5(10)-triene-9,17-dione monooxygenase reductase component